MGRRPYQRYSRKWNRKCKTRDQFQTTPVEGGFNLLCGVTVNQILFKHLRLGVVFQIVVSLINALSLLASQIVSFISYPLSTILPRVPLQGPEPNLETRIRDLEQLCKELAASVQGLQKNFEQLTANGDSSRCCLNLTSSASSLVPTSTKSLSACLHPRTAFELLTTDSDSSQNRLPLTLSSSFPAPPVCPPPPPPLPPPCFVVNAPPPPPPPPPPLGFLDSQVTLKKLPATEKKTTPKCKVTRPTISVEELRSVKLKKTPAVQKKERPKTFTPTGEVGIRISLDALRSVKLKKTSPSLRQTSPNKSKSPKSKTNFRPVLRRLPVGHSPGGTPKTTSATSPFCSETDDMTPLLTRALLKRFNDLNMSFEEDKENDGQFL